MKLELFFNNNEIEIDGSTIAPLTFSVADARKPEKRNRNRSKTIKVKGTASNLKALSRAYNLALKASVVGFEFNPNDEITAKIRRNGIWIFDGVANLLETEINNGVYTFNFQIFGKSIGLFEKLGEKTLAELDWSEYDHALTISNVELSWDTSVVLDGTPTSNFTGTNPQGWGYLYGLINFGYAANELTPKTNELIPYFYLKEALEKCFAVGGYTITGGWIDLALTKRIVFGSGGGDRILLTALEIAARLVNFTITGSVSEELPNFGYYLTNNGDKVYKYHGVQLNKMSDISPFAITLVNDDRFQMDESTGQVTIGSTGNYNINFTVELNVTLMDLTEATIWENVNTYFYLRVKKNGTNFNQVTAFRTATGSFSFSAINQSLLFAGDVLEFYIEHNYLWNGAVTTGNAIPLANLDYEIVTASLTITSINGLLAEGDTVECGRWMPDMKCRDFVNDCILLGNLYFSEPNDDNEIRIESFADYYGTTAAAENYSKKLDYSKKITIQTSVGIEGKNYKWKFAEDRDAWKDYYFKTWGSDYGDLDYTIPTTFKKGEKIYQLNFAQSIPVINGSCVIPQIVKKDPITSATTPHKGKPRIFIYNKLQTGDWSLLNSTTGAATVETSYPQFHHLNNLTTPTFDLNFGVPIETYFNATAYTTNNLFAANYETQIKELTSIDSKFFKAFFKINERNLIGEFMSRLVNIEGVVYRKNLIQDFDATGYQTTLMELIKVLEATPRQAMSISPIGSSDLVMKMGNSSPLTTANTAADLTLDRNSSTLLTADCSAAARTITLDIDVPEGTEFTIMRTGTTDLLKPMTVQTSDTSTISGNANLVYTNEFDVVTVIFTGGLYYIKL